MWYENSIKSLVSLNEAFFLYGYVEAAHSVAVQRSLNPFVEKTALSPTAKVAIIKARRSVS